MSKVKSLLGKLLAVLLAGLLIACCIAPFQRAKENTKQEFRNTHNYTNVAKEYYRALFSAENNLNAFTVGFEINDSFQFLKSSQGLFNSDEALNHKLMRAYTALESAPDPGDRDLVLAVKNSFEAYNKYRDLIFSAKYYEDGFIWELLDARADLRRASRKLKSELYQ